MKSRMSRRQVLVAGMVLPLSAACSRGERRATEPPGRSASPDARRQERMIDLIDAPSNLGLRPLKPGVEPGAWRAPEALERAGLAERLEPARRVRLARPAYRVEAEPGTRIRNGASLRAFNLALSEE